MIFKMTFEKAIENVEMLPLPPDLTTPVKDSVNGVEEAILKLCETHTINNAARERIQEKVRQMWI